MGNRLLLIVDLRIESFMNEKTQILELFTEFETENKEAID